MPEQTNTPESPEPDDTSAADGRAPSSGEAPGSSGRHAAPSSVGASDEVTPGAKRSRKDERQAKPKKTNWPLELGVIVLIAVVLSFCLQTFAGRQWYVPSESMEPTLIGCAGCTGDRIVTQKISYYTGDPKPGDVIVFKGPTDSWGQAPLTPVRSSNTILRGIQQGLSYVGLQPPNENDLVKRVIAVGGQRIECRPETGVTVNEKKIVEPYLAESAKQMATQDSCWGKPFGPITIPQGNVFVMGDNRMNSADSRYHIEDQLQGTVPKADIRGKVVAVIFPFSRWQTVDSINPQQG